MKVIDPGHRYALQQLDIKPGDLQILRFVKRIGNKFPGNEPPGYCGTTTQEVLRALIDRTKYVDRRAPHEANHHVLTSLRQALIWLERRAAVERGDAEAASAFVDMFDDIELQPTCAECGHVMCRRAIH